MGVEVWVGEGRLSREKGARIGVQMGRVRKELERVAAEKSFRASCH